MIVGIGVDIVEIERMRRAMEQNGFVQRLFTPAEQELLEKRHWSVQVAAGNFAAKEAVSKALGTGIVHMKWTDIEVLRDEMGKPVAALTGGALAAMERIGGKRLLVSISHTAVYAVAQAIIEEAAP